MDALSPQQEPEAITAAGVRQGQAEHASPQAFLSERLSIPRRGHVLTTIAEEHGRPVREAVAILTRALARQKDNLPPQTYLARRLPEPASRVVRSQADLLAWSLVSMWLTAFSTRLLPQGAGLKEAEHWFAAGAADEFITARISESALKRAQSALSDCAGPAAYLELLPYILDPHGPGSRLSIRRDEKTRGARDRKRAEGVFYTPADVAEFMVGRCLSKISGRNAPPRLLDPACGTAVFLRAALAALKRQWPARPAEALAETCLFGADIDPWAPDAAAFVLLADCLADGGPVRVPLLLWHRLRINLACVDALRLDPESGPKGRRTFDRVRKNLNGGELPAVDGQGPSFRDRIPLNRLFAQAANGPFIVFGNPPYADLGARDDLPALASAFQSLGGGARPGTEIYTLFVEQMVRLAPAGQAAGTLVLPLSLACNTGRQYSHIRSFMQNTPGTWEFAFFDRQPHALFGEDVKTRNAILIWDRRDADKRAVIASGPLRKWRGDSRAAMFSGIRFTPVACDIKTGIPKIDGDCQARAFSALAARWDRFENTCAGMRRTSLTRVLKSGGHEVFVGPTAYNFLNAYLRPPPGLLACAPALSEHPLYGIGFASEEDALAGFAVLSSHLAYWWWHVTGDGFHVSGRFISDLPFGPDALSGETRTTLSALGSKLWSLIRTNPIISVNRGRTSLAFSPNGYDELRGQIDKTLAGLAGLEPGFVAELQQFTAHTIKAEQRTATNEQE